MKACLLGAPWFVCLLAAAGLSLTSAQQAVTSIKLGEKLELFPDNFTETITGILWKYGPDKVTEWDEGLNDDQVDYYGTYRNRTALDRKTGKMVINNMNIQDSGEYSVEVNGLVQSRTYKVEVIPASTSPNNASQDLQQLKGLMAALLVLSSLQLVWCWV